MDVSETHGIGKIETELIVIGGGGAGLAAALSAAE
jgi:succinate dehydrogenase/fumarate reductase flavoprotein subunit